MLCQKYYAEGVAVIQSRVRRGRPTVVDRRAVAIAALQLWSERGYAATTWQDLADVTGVSVRSLIRHFGRRPEVLTAALDYAVDLLDNAFADIPDDTPVDEAIRAAVVDGMRAQMVDLGAFSSWASLLAAEPELEGWLRHGFTAWIDALAAEIVRRMPGLDPSVCRAIAAGVEAIANTTLLEWSRGGATGDPAERVGKALDCIRIVPSTTPATTMKNRRSA